MSRRGRITRTKHQVLRCAAREAQAARKAERLARRRAEEQITGALRDPARGALPAGGARLRRGAEREGLPPHLYGELRQYYRENRLPLQLQKRITRLARVASQGSLSMVASWPDLELLTLLARQPWIQQPEHLDVRWLSRLYAGESEDHFIAHLLARWPVPAFLLRSLRRTWPATPLHERAWALSLVTCLGQGGSLLASGLLPAPLTRRMAALLVAAPEHLTAGAALRRAQILGSGGEEPLVEAVLATPLRRLLAPRREAWLQPMLSWVAGRRELDAAQAAAVLVWLWGRHATGADLDPRGRPVASVLRRMERDSRDRILLDGQAPWPTSRLTPLDLRQGGDRWQVAEVTSPDALLAEARALSNCAFGYLQRLREGDAALFSVRRDGRRVGLVEVALSWGTIRQAKGPANRPLAEPTRAIVRRWAEQNLLTLGGW